MRLRLEFGPRRDGQVHDDPHDPDDAAEPNPTDRTAVQDFDAVEYGDAPPRPQRMFLSNLRRRVGRSGAGEFAAPAGTRVFLGVLVLAMFCGPAALVALALAPQPEASQPAASSPGVGSRDAVRAAGAAEHLVRVWLSAGRTDALVVKAAMGPDPGQLTLPDQRPAPPTWVEASDVAPTRPGEWTVTVAAAGGGLAGGQAAYTVLVWTTPEAATPLTLPARVAPPQPAEPSRDDLQSLTDNHPVAVTTGGFLRALLTGTDDVSRWAAPESAVQPLGKVCRSVVVDRIETAEADQAAAAVDVTVLATVTCVSSTSQAGTPTAYTLQYPLTLRLRGGRWEVAGHALGLPGDAATGPSAEPTTPPPPASGPTGPATSSPTTRPDETPAAR